MSAQFTPGPWKVNGADVLEATSRGRSMHIATCDRVYGADCGIGVNEANARLIAAAPDLLAALRALLDATSALDGLEDLLAGPEAAARAALAKAEATP